MRNSKELQERRREFRAALERLVRVRFPQARIIRSAQFSDRTAGLSRCHVRMLIQEGCGKVAALGVAPFEGAAEIDASLSAGLIWTSLVRRRFPEISELRLFVPAARSSAVLNRIAWLDRHHIAVSLYEFDAEWGEGLPLRTVSGKCLPRFEADYCWPDRPPFKTSPLLIRLMQINPDLIRRHPHVRGYDSLRIRGLEFARVYGPGRETIAFGLGRRQLLREDNWSQLEALVSEIAEKRRYDSPDKRHPFFRRQQERWLESMLLDDVGRLGEDLDRRHFYAQVPAYLGEAESVRRGMIDLLAVDRSGRLVVIELKVSEDVDLPFQGLDYWSRVHRHNLRGDFERHGYFQGVRLRKELPLLYLVSPIFRFHKSFETVACYVDRRVEVWKIAINMDWMRGVRVLRKERVTIPSASSQFQGNFSVR